MALVFQYGSNMSTTRLNSPERLCGDATPKGKARTLEYFQLDFTVWSKKNCCAAADIIRGKGVQIWGVLYDIPDCLVKSKTAGIRKSLDEIEGKGTNYRREEISIISLEGKRLSAITYVVKNRKAGLKTSLVYVKHIMKGVKEHNLPCEYGKYVLSRIIKNNPELRPDLSRLYDYKA